MNTEISKLCEQLNEVYNGDPWYGRSIIDVLLDVPDTVAFITPLHGTHTIAELLSHIIAWKKVVLERLSGNNSFNVERPETYNLLEYGTTEKEQWVNLLRSFNDCHQELLDMLKNQKDAFLQNKVASKNYNFLYLIKGSIQHDIYHIGQIALLKKSLTAKKAVQSI